MVEPASLSLATLAPCIDVCDLCATPGETLRAAVTVRHPHGGALSMAACDRCAMAMRRILAAAGSASSNGPAYVNAASLDAPSISAADSSPDFVGPPALVHEYADPFFGPDGVTYVIRAWGQARADSTWIGWLTFVGIDSAVVRKTPRETSQSSLDHLTYWASGLQPSYFEGAFQRST